MKRLRSGGDTEIQTRGILSVDKQQKRNLRDDKQPDDEEAYWSGFAAGMTKTVVQDPFESEPVAAAFSLLSKSVNDIAGEKSLVSDATSPVAVRRTRRGRIRKELRHLYFQDSFPCGVAGCTTCTEDVLDSDAERLAATQPVIILDLPILMHEADLLWGDPALNNCVLLQSLMSQVSPFKLTEVNSLSVQIRLPWLAPLGKALTLSHRCNEVTDALTRSFSGSPGLMSPRPREQAADHPRY